MKKYILFLSAFLCIYLVKAQDKRALVSLQDVWASSKFSARGVYGIKHLNDGKHYLSRKGSQILKYQYDKEEAVAILFDEADAVNAGMKHKMANYELSESGNLLLIETNVTPMYRHSKLASYYVWNLDSKNLIPVFSEEQVFFATLSPDEKKVAFVNQNNLFYQDLQSGEVVKITSDGVENQIINGKSDWVYEEEFVLVKAFEWAPNSEYIAFFRFDESQVKEYKIPVYNNGNYPDLYTYKYPKSGEDNSVVDAKIYQLSTKKTVTALFDSNEDRYLPRMHWSPKSEVLYVQKLNRNQNHLQLIAINLSNGNLSTVWEEKSETYIDITDDLSFISQNEFIISSERDGYNHLWRFDIKNGKEFQITKGKYDVTDFYGYHAKSGRLFFQAAKSSAVNRGLYSIKINGKNQLALSDENGTNSASYSSDFSYYIHTFSNSNQVPLLSVKNSKNQNIRVLEDNAILSKNWVESGFGNTEFFEAEVAEGVLLNAWMIKPKDFSAANTYPVLMFCYGGPGSQMVNNTWNTSNKAYFHYLATKGYIVVCFDNRGTGSRGAEFKKMTYQNLGEIEAEDQINAAKYMANLPFVDAKRIGIFGWSYGGYLSLLASAKGGNVFSSCVSVAPVTDWRFYDNIYTERYMRRPIDNELGYQRSSVLTYSANLRDLPLFLVHGTFDDNVHPQNSFELTKTLVEQNISFESAFYTNKNHGIYGGATRLHLFTAITKFLDTNLLDGAK